MYDIDLDEIDCESSGGLLFQWCLIYSGRDINWMEFALPRIAVSKACV